MVNPSNAKVKPMVNPLENMLQFTGKPLRNHVNNNKTMVSRSKTTTNPNV